MIRIITINKKKKLENSFWCLKLKNLQHENASLISLVFYHFMFDYFGINKDDGKVYLLHNQILNMIRNQVLLRVPSEAFPRCQTIISELVHTRGIQRIKCNYVS
uniref:Putative ovule protein n=1 Tax=Solanum chacoense TaxID=4108 RepID=A0A0V0HYH8_SOLCH